MDSREYWRKRETENLRNNLKTEAEYIKTINGYYDYMLDQIQKEINGFYTKYANKEGITLAEAKKRVAEADIKAYERKAAKYVKEKDFSKEANEEMRLYNATMKINRLEMLKANIGLELVDGFDGLQKYFDQILTDRTLSEFERQAGILGKTIQNNAQAVHAIVNASFNNAKFSDRIWMYQNMMKAELSKLLQTGLIQGQNPRKLATHLEKLFGVRKSDTERLMRTELARVQTEAQKQSFERNGFTMYEFVALGSACEICRAIDGEHFEVKKMMPGENAPPMHPNCRCSVAAHKKNDDYKESDMGNNISEFFTGISKQKRDFTTGLEKVKNKDAKILLEQSLDRVTVKRAKGRRSKYSARDKTVYLSKSAGTDTLAHELMHEIDDTYGLTMNGVLSKSVEIDYGRLKSLSKGYGKSIEEMLYSKYPKAFVEEDMYTMSSKYRAVSDILNGMSKGEINLGFTHSKDYWNGSKKVEAETFAQFGRVLFNNQDALEMMREIFPNSYAEIMETLERMIK